MYQATCHYETADSNRKHIQKHAHSAKDSEATQKFRAGLQQILLRLLAQSLQNLDCLRKDDMSDDPLMPSEIRQKVLTQHREIEQTLSELEACQRTLLGAERSSDTI